MNRTRTQSKDRPARRAVTSDEDVTDRAVRASDLVLRLQRTAGNRATGVLIALQRQPPQDAGVDIVPAGVPEQESSEAETATDDAGAARDGRPGPVTVTAPGPTGTPAGGASGAGPGTTVTPAGPDQTTAQAPTPSGPAGSSPAAAAPTPVQTTDVPRPPPRPSLALPTRTPIVVPGAVPPATETMPDFGIDAGAEFWGISAVNTYVTVLVEGWRQRRAAQGETIDVAATRASFVTDFDETLQGWFKRSQTFKAPWASREASSLRWLAEERRRLRRLVARERVADGGRRRALTRPEQDAWVEAGLVVSRQVLVDRAMSHVTEGAWGWMVERREHLDFVTITQRGVQELRGFAPTSAVNAVDTVRAELARLGRSLTEAERERAVTRATEALRRRSRDRTATLTPEQETDAVAAAETAKLGTARARELIRTASIAVEEPGWVNVHERTPDGQQRWGPVWGSNSIGVLPTTARFVLELIDTYGPRFTANNYGGHGGGSFSGRGRSLDLTIPERQPDGFFEPNAAIRLALAIDTAAGAVGAGWRVLYNDFSVARAVNERLGSRRIVEMANTERSGGRISNINWHGPLVNHFHLDLAY